MNYLFKEVRLSNGCQCEKHRVLYTVKIQVLWFIIIIKQNRVNLVPGSSLKLVVLLIQRTKLEQQNQKAVAMAIPNTPFHLWGSLSELSSSKMAISPLAVDAIISSRLLDKEDFRANAIRCLKCRHLSPSRTELVLHLEKHVAVSAVQTTHLRINSVWQIQENENTDTS